MRKKYIIANWKENMINSEVSGFINSLKAKIIDCDLSAKEVIICPSFVSVITAYDCSRNTPIKVGAQDLSLFEKGAYTGEVSVGMVKEFCEFVIIGHSERRKFFHETDETVNIKVHIALKNGLNPIICVGESMEQRDQGKTQEVIINQLKQALMSVKKENLGSVIIAYEPIWAISGGNPNHKPATANDAEAVHRLIREQLGGMYGTDIAEIVPIIYGGSVKPENINDFLSKANIDGGLIGGASLDLESFFKMVVC